MSPTASTSSRQSALHGAQRPRYESLPSFTSSAGREAVDLAAQAGLILDPWQQHVLEHSLGERGDGKHAAPEVGLIVPRQNGKGSIIEARELWGLFLGGEKLIMHSAHEFKTAQEGFRRIRELIEGNSSLSKRVKKISTSHGDEGIELKSGARLRFVARSRGSGRGFSGDCVFLDEAYALSDAAMDALMPTLSARPNAQIWYTSSAPLPDSEVLRRLCLRGRAGEDARLAYFEWCADSTARTDDRAAWAMANPSLGIRLTEEFTEREHGALSPEGFLRERLGVWHEFEKSDVLPNWQGLSDPDSSLPESAPVVFGLDISPARTHSAIVAVGEREDAVRHVEVVDYRPETSWVVPRFAALRDRWGEIAVVIDERSAAGSLIDDLRALDGVTVHVPTTREIGVAAGRFYDACTESVASLRHLDDPVLNAAVDAAATRPIGDAWTWDRRKPQADITALVAATLALWGWEAHGVPFDIASQVF